MYACFLKLNDDIGNATKQNSLANINSVHRHICIYNDIMGILYPYS